MQHLNTLFNLVKQAGTPVAPGSPEHQALVEQLNNKKIDQEQFDNAMNGLTPIHRGSEQHQALVGQLNNKQITQGQFNALMNGYTPVTPGSSQHQDLVGQLDNKQIDQEQFNNAMLGYTPVTRGSEQHQDLVGWLNSGRITPEQFNNAMNGITPAKPVNLKSRNILSPDTTLKQRSVGGKAEFPTTLTLDPYTPNLFNDSPFNTPKFMQPDQIGIAINPSNYTNPQTYELPEDLTRRIRQEQLQAGGWETQRGGLWGPWQGFWNNKNQNPVNTTPSTQPTSQPTSQPTPQPAPTPQAAPTPAPQPDQQPAPTPAPTPQSTPAPQPTPAPTPQPNTPSVGSAVGKATYNPASITRQMMNKYRKYTSARNMNSDMDRWKTWQAMQGNRNASNADYYAAKKNNFM